MAKNLVTHTINGTNYVCLPWSFTLACASRGPNCIMAVSAVAAGAESKKLEDMSRAEFMERIDLMKRDLQQVMIKPRLVDTFSENDDVVTWQEMGDDFAALHRAVTRQDSEDVENFPESSGDQTG